MPTASIIRQFRSYLAILLSHSPSSSFSSSSSSCFSSSSLGEIRMRRRKSLMSVLFLFFFIGSVFGEESPSNNEKNAMRFELLHRHSVDLSPPKTQLERVNELVQMDKIRVQIISQRLRHQHNSYRRKISETRNSTSSAAAATSSSFVIPIGSGAYTGTGQYFVPFRLGSPSKKFLLVADTGSDITWINCQYLGCGRNCHHGKKRYKKAHRKRLFNADRSSTFEPIPCSTAMCKNLPFSLVRCPTKMTTCHYDYRYADGSSSLGIFANETVTANLANGRKSKLTEVVVGCSSSSVGTSFRSSDGVLGLGYSKYSFAVKAAQKFGGKFSYCLVDHLSPRNVSNYLTFGPRSKEHKSSNSTTGSSASDAMQYTQLILNVIDGFYPVNVAGISIGGMMLKIRLNVWDVKSEGGVIMDSGTSLTYLAEPAYRAVMAALKLPLMLRFKKIKLEPFDFCFSSSGFDESVVPKLVFHFVDSARFEPPVKSYIIDVSDGVKCIGLMSNGWPAVSIIGNIMQQNHLWEFDLAKERLGFVPSTCARD